MAIKRKTWVAAFILLVILTASGLYNADPMIKKQTGVMVTEQKSWGLNLMELQGEDLRKVELWLADLNERTPLGSTDKTDGKDSTVITDNLYRPPLM